MVLNIIVCSGFMLAVYYIIPGHGCICKANEVRARIELDHAFVQDLRDGGGANDSLIGSSS